MEDQGNVLLLERAMKAISILQRELQSKEKADSEPIAIIGMACRFPGGCDTPEKFWDFLKDGKNGIVDIPASRWTTEDYCGNNRSLFNQMYANKGGFLQHDIGEFDQKFFRISPREVEEMDPQHRLLLEVSWEALERAGQNPEILKGSQTGVYVGIISNEYGTIARDYTKIDQYIGTGTPQSIASGRIAYTFGFNGPALSIDTACSSSLVSVHLACESLKRKECDMALAGGVNLMLSPVPTLALCMMGALSKNGRCKTFDANADGYVRSEGCGMVILKRLVTAQEHGDRIHAVISGSAINHNGVSSGLTVPSGNSQIELLKKALEAANISPEDLDYIETHGTGTELGDPIEMRAIGEIFGCNDQRKGPLVLGAVKTNIGHLEAAAGIAGLIKVLLSLDNKEIPPNINLNTINPKIDLDKIPAVLPQSSIRWETNGSARRAGVSSFGFSGTNAHLIITEQNDIKSIQKDKEIERPLHIFTISAQSENSIKELTEKYREFLKENPHIKLQDLCYTSNACRAKFTQRAAFVCKNISQLETRLKKFADNHYSGNDINFFSGRSDRGANSKIAWIFRGGFGSFENNGKNLLKKQSMFSKSMEKCDILFKPYLSCSMIDYMSASSSEKKVDQVVIESAAAFSWEYSLAELWRSWGITPNAVFGERIGLFVGACIADIISLQTAVKCVVKYGQLLSKIEDTKSITVFAETNYIENLLSNYNTNDIGVAAVYGPTEAVISGKNKIINEVVKILNEKKIEVAFNENKRWWPSTANRKLISKIDEIDELKNYRKSKMRIICGATGASEEHNTVTPSTLLIEELSSTVRFQSGIEYLYGLKYKTFMEIGFNEFSRIDGLSYLSKEKTNNIKCSLTKFSWNNLLCNVAHLYCIGIDIDWASFDKDYSRKKLTLPTYPFERKRYWINIQSDSKKNGHFNKQTQNFPITKLIDGSGDAEKQNALSPLEGRQMHASIKTKILEYYLSVERLPEVVDNHNVLHVGYYQEMLYDAMEKLYGTCAYKIKTIRYMFLLLIDDKALKKLQLVVEETKNRDLYFRFFSWDDEKKDWVLHVDGYIQMVKKNEAPKEYDFSFEEIKAKCKNKYSHDEFYQMMQKRGYNLGDSVKLIDEVWYREGEALARFKNPKLSNFTFDYKIGFHPGVLDACAQLYSPGFPESINDEKMFMMVRWENFSFISKGMSDEFWGHVNLDISKCRNGKIKGSFNLYDNKENLIASCKEAQMVELSYDRIKTFSQVVDQSDIKAERLELINKELIMKLRESGDDLRLDYMKKYLIETLSEILKLPSHEINESEPFQAYGMDSLVGVEYSKKISADFGANVNFQLIVSSETIALLAKNLLVLFSPNILNDSDWEKPVDEFTEKIGKNMEKTVEQIKKDAILNHEIVIDKSAKSYDYTKKYKKILLTGATGYLGVFVLKELLDKTSADILCIVRANSREHGKDRITKILKRYKLWDQRYEDKIFPVVGDIAKKRLGLGKSEYKYMLNKIDAIYHTAADTNHVQSYESLKHVNAYSTLELIKIACKEKVKPIFFVSTFGVPMRFHEDGIQFLQEEEVSTDISGSYTFISGYWAGKWVSEQLLDQAHKRGIPTMIFRVGEMTGHSKTGIGRTDDMFVTLLKLFYSVDAKTEWQDAVIDLVPVDYISEAIVYLSRKEKNHGNVFFLTNPKPAPFKTFFDVVEDLTQKILKEIKFEEWVSACGKSIGNGSENGLSKILDVYFTKGNGIGGLDYRFMFYFQNFHINNAKVENALQGSGIACPPVEKTLLKLYAKYFIECGFWQ